MGAGKISLPLGNAFSLASSFTPLLMGSTVAKNTADIQVSDNAGVYIFRIGMELLQVLKAAIELSK